MYVCMYVCSTLHVYVTSVLVDDLMAVWLVEMNSNIEMFLDCICKCRGTGFRELRSLVSAEEETHRHCL